MMNKLFRAASLTNRGTLFQLKNDFGHRAVTNDVMNSFNHVENFVRFVTEVHVVYLALKLFGIDDVGGTPTTDCDSLDKTAERIVDEVWVLPPITDVTDVLDCAVDDDFVPDNWCTCEEGRVHIPVQCYFTY